MKVLITPCTRRVVVIMRKLVAKTSFDELREFRSVAHVEPNGQWWSVLLEIERETGKHDENGWPLFEGLARFLVTGEPVDEFYRAGEFVVAEGSYQIARCTVIKDEAKI